MSIVEMVCCIIAGNVNDWFGKQTGKLLGPLEKLTIPSKLPHPHNAGLEPAKEVTQPPRKVQCSYIL